MLMLFPILIPIVAGSVILSGLIKDSRWLKYITLSTVAVSALMVSVFCALPSPEPFTLIRFTDRLSLSFGLDGLGKPFAALVSALWIPIAAYAFGHMKPECDERKFCGFFVMAMGATLGIAFSASLLTLYLFYECLGFVLLPLTPKQPDGDTRIFSNRYMAYMVGECVIVLIGLLFLLEYAPTLDFALGGVFNAESISAHSQPLQWIILIFFLGFGIKAAIFPLHAWLLEAASASTPIIALLCAVFLGNSGVFAIARTLYFTFGTSLLSGGFAQNILLILSILTILFGSVMALRTPHLTHRLIYSAICNFSCMLLGFALMSAEGASGGLMHLMVHAFLSLALLFAARSISRITGVERVSDLSGLSRRMPVTMTCFTLCSLMLIGIPPLGSFGSRWHMSLSAAQTGHPLALIGTVALFISQVMAALYLFGPIITAYFKPVSEIEPGGDVLVGVVDGIDGMASDEKSDAHSHASIPFNKDEAGLWMTVPLVTLTALTLLISLFFDPLYALVRNLM